MFRRRSLNPMALLATLLLVVWQGDCRAATESMGSLSEWSVSLITDVGQPYCSLLWDSQVGETVEIRAGLKDVDLLIADTAWKLPDKQPTKIIIHGRRNSATVSAVAADRTTLDVVRSEGNSALIRSIVRSAIKGTVDIELSFSGNEPDWTVPISRIFSLHDTVTACLQRLYRPVVHKDTSAPPEPF